MTKDTLINEEVNSDRTDLRHTFKDIREALEKAQTREDLTELYKQTVYMILMTHSSPVEGQLGKDLKKRRATTEKEFARTVRLINKRAKQIGVEAGYSEDWKNMQTNGYETEEGNLLEAESNVGIVRK